MLSSGLNSVSAGREKPRVLSGIWVAEAVAKGYAAVHAVAKLTAKRLPNNVAESARVAALFNLPLRAGIDRIHWNKRRAVTKRLIHLVEGTRLRGITVIQAMQEMGSTLQPTRNFILSRFPAEVIDECATMLRQRASQAGIAEQDLYSLLVIGMATWELERTSLCRFCPRFALVGTAFCLEHGQGKQLPGTPGEKAARYRSGKEVAQEYHYYLPQTPAYILLSERTIPSFLARLMIGRPIPDEGRSLRAIKRKIAGSRRLVEIIGMDFQSLSESQLYRRLRERIDPGEARPRVWLWKLGRLYHWYGYEDRIALIKNLSVNNG